jgi:HK97 family phage portal protein
MGILARIGHGLELLTPTWLRRQGAGGWRVTMPATYWQQGLSPLRPNEITYSAVFAAVDRISSDIAKIPLRHWQKQPNGTRILLDNSPALSVWRRPNPYQTYFDLMKSIVMSQLYRGNAYVYCYMNNRNQVREMYCLSPDRCWPYIYEGEVFYRVGQDPFADIRIDEMVPARFIMHHRMATLNNPIIGVSPLVAAAATVAAGQSIQSHSATFFGNMARPSGYLTTAGKLDRQKAEDIKKRWTDYHGGPGQSGRTAVLEQGLEYKQLTMTAVDAQLIEQLRWTIEDIARVFQIPAFLIGDMTRMMARSSESLMKIYYGSCLMAHFRGLIERMNMFYELNPVQEYLEFDIDELYATEFDVRVTSWAKAVQGGLASPNEGRDGAFGFNPVDGGDDVFMQQQMIPIDMLGDLAKGQLPGTAPAEPTDINIEAALASELRRRLAQWAA